MTATQFRVVGHVYEADEMRTLVIEAVPTFSLCSFAEAVQVLLAVVGKHIVFTGNVENFPRLGALQHLLGRIKF
jgi:hypothetical protein